MVPAVVAPATYMPAVALISVDGSMEGFRNPSLTVPAGRPRMRPVAAQLLPSPRMLVKTSKLIMPPQWPPGCSTGTPEAESVEEEILPPIMAPPAAAKPPVSNWTDFDRYMEEEPELPLDSANFPYFTAAEWALEPVLFAATGKHMHFSGAALKREVKEKRRARAEPSGCPTGSRPIWSASRPNSPWIRPLGRLTRACSCERRLEQDMEVRK
jgi:hypothetical protein